MAFLRTQKKLTPLLSDRLRSEVTREASSWLCLMGLFFFNVLIASVQEIISDIRQVVAQQRGHIAQGPPYNRFLQQMWIPMHWLEEKNSKGLE